MSTDPAKQNDKYGEKLDALIHRLWTIQDRISELKEFEKQWKELFDLLKKKTGKDCKVKILNSTALLTYHWDRYQVLLSDLFSLHDNELEEKNKDALLRQSIHHLKLLQPEAYIDPDYKVAFVHNPRHLLSTEDRKRHVEELRIAEAKRTHRYKKEALARLFPNINSDFKVTDADILDLLGKIKLLKAEIKGPRHFFNHKYDNVAVAKYADSVKDFSLEKAEENVDKIFSIASDLGLIYKSASYAKSDFNYDGEISDQLDLILFGNINGAIERFNEAAGPGLYYWQAREKYFASDHLLEIIAD